ncbi:MAG: hypothetical protein F7C08_03275 [Desulfurococcales archaeon]|nr:hypothetical protein [Desulfurococcales archaeon]MCE4605534.1 hypothetical protein [Desulfurococcales archaeon]
MRVKLWLMEADPVRTLSSPDIFILRGRRAAMGNLDVVYSRWSGPRLTVYGSYQRPSGDRFLRRITGGPEASMGPGSAYLAAVREYRWSLATMFRENSKLVECLSGSSPQGGRADGVVIGVTKVAGHGITEVLMARDPGLGRVRECLSSVYGRISGEEELDPDLAPDIAVKRNSSPEWLRPGRSYNIESTSSNNGFYIRFLAWAEDGLIHWIDLDGVFYASPPSQVYALVETVSQAMPSPGLVYEFTAAWSTFVDTAGISVDEVEEAFRGLVERVEGAG